MKNIIRVPACLPTAGNAFCRNDVKAIKPFHFHCTLPWASQFFAIVVGIFLLFNDYAMAQTVKSPDELYGPLFREVQLQRVFADGKTFVDAVPKRDPAAILQDYERFKPSGNDLKKFVAANFDLPAAPTPLNYVQPEKNLVMHINNLWSVLKRAPDTVSAAGNTLTGSLLPLPYPYIVPGGRFREVYYWDSYFTMLGLKESGEVEMITQMINNFAFLINTYGHIPNGNRSYYLSRSQPPYFSLMVELLAGIKGPAVYTTYLSVLEKEYAYWMEGADKIKKGESLHHLVRLADGSLLNRYSDAKSTPRPESFKEDFELAQKAADELAMRIRVSSPEALEKILNDKRADVAHQLRSGAESGWDFSTRWMEDDKKLETIQTSDIVPVDLNCLLYALELTISKAKKTMRFESSGAVFLQMANKRKAAILKYCWNPSTGFFYDYHAGKKQQLKRVTAAGLFPLFVMMATPAQASAVALTTQKLLLKKGGIVTTTNNSGQQWDAPNGWAPLQWTSITALANYGKSKLAKDIAVRWLTLNEKVYAATGKMMEKYNVVDITREAGGGEYPSQDGFGWTNGVYLALKKLYGQ